MKYAVMSDVHANPTALAKAVDDARSCGVDSFVCLGDIVGYGPSPDEAITLSRKVFGNRVVVGNHDAALLREMSMDSFSRRAQKSIIAQRCMVGGENLDWLGACPSLLREGSMLFAHGDVCRDGDVLKPGFGYVFRPDDVRRTLSSVDGSGVNIVFVGHTHEPAMWRLGSDGSVEMVAENQVSVAESDRYVVNVGTIGCPRSVPFASYVVVDAKEDGMVDIELRKLTFDYIGYRDSLLAANAYVPTWLEDFVARLGHLNERSVQ
jgi:predicted phosphodiesterase